MTPLFCLILLLTVPALASELYVIDGDTFHHPDYGRVRLYGIDTPEKGQPKYEEAKEAL
ncbi:MAG: hypothetical protein Q6359_10670 [Candidatus Brocadiales bacterium]|nr:hypothetical protein [Candidatus Brocadiales bacterium]